MTKYPGLMVEGPPVMTKSKEQKALDAIADIVLAYKPKAKSKPARRRKRRATKIAKWTK